MKHRKKYSSAEKPVPLMSAMFPRALSSEANTRCQLIRYPADPTPMSAAATTISANASDSRYIAPTSISGPNASGTENAKTWARRAKAGRAHVTAMHTQNAAQNDAICTV